MPPSFAFCGSNGVHWPWPHLHTKNTAADICTSPRGCMCTKAFLSSHHHKRPSHLRLPGSMGQAVAKAKQGAEPATQKTEERKVMSKSNEAKELIEFMDKQYESKVQDAKSFDEFYHAIYEIIELFCEARGQLQYKIPSKEDLKAAYTDHAKQGETLTKAQFMKITENVVRMDSFAFGRAAIDVLIVLFGVPACALLVKRIVPGLKSLSDDVVIPMATSGAAVYLAKTNKL